MESKLQKILAHLKENSALFIGLAIVLALSLITFHTDLSNLSIIASRISKGDFTIYSNYTVLNETVGIPIMPPLIVFVDGFFYSIVKLTGLINFNFAVNGLHLFQYFVLKLRFVLVFLLSYPLIKYLASVYTKDKENSLQIAALWITSPILIYLTFTQGNNDIYPAVLTLLFLVFAFKQKNFTAMILLGLTAALKSYAIFLFIPVSLILSEKDVKKTAGYLSTAGLAFLLPTVPYLKDFFHFSQGGREGIFILSTVIPSTFSYYVFPLLYFIVILYLYFDDNLKKIQNNKSEYLVQTLLIIMSLFYILGFFHPQWFLWALPFLALTAYKTKRLFLLYIGIVTSFLFMTIAYFPRNLDLSMFKPLLYHFGINPVPVGPGVAQLLAMSGSIFSAFFIVYIYFSIKDLGTKPEKLTKNLVAWNLLPLLISSLFLVSLLIPQLVAKF